MKGLKLKLKYFLLGYSNVLELYPKTENGFKKDLKNIAGDFKLVIKRGKLAK
jgi:hypothetical protein